MSEKMFVQGNSLSEEQISMMGRIGSAMIYRKNSNRLVGSLNRVKMYALCTIFALFIAHDVLLPNWVGSDLGVSGLTFVSRRSARDDTGGDGTTHVTTKNCWDDCTRAEKTKFF